jgi:hypothetical protein
MFQVLHMDVEKVDWDVSHVASVSDECCKRFFKMSLSVSDVCLQAF